MSVLALIKLLGGKALVGKGVLIAKGLAATHAGGSGAVLAKAAIATVQHYGLITGVLMVAQMLIIIGTATVGTEVAAHAWASLNALAKGKVKKGVKEARKAMRKANGIVTVWVPAS